MNRTIQWGVCWIASVVAAAALTGCVSKGAAPVVERTEAPAARVPAGVPTAKAADFYTVKKGDTLYSIALEHGLAYRDLAAWNAIDNPGMIRVGQQLRVVPPEGTAVAQPVTGPAPVESKPLGAAAAPAVPTPSPNTDMRKREPLGGKQPWSEQALAAAQKAEEPRLPVASSAPPAAAPAQPAAAAGAEEWTWPAAGKVIAPFVEGGSKGIDIGGKTGDPIVAAEAGKVIYAGSGIRGYGNLVIVQHANGASSVYAHNSKLLAKEGQSVGRGQKIAELGSSDTDQPKLHFEIRRQGKPVDPLRQLPAR